MVRCSTLLKKYNIGDQNYQSIKGEGGVTDRKTINVLSLHETQRDQIKKKKHPSKLESPDSTLSGCRLEPGRNSELGRERK